MFQKFKLKGMNWGRGLVNFEGGCVLSHSLKNGLLGRPHGFLTNLNSFEQVLDLVLSNCNQFLKVQGTK